MTRGECASGFTTGFGAQERADGSNPGSHPIGVMNRAEKASAGCAAPASQAGAGRRKPPNSRALLWCCAAPGCWGCPLDALRQAHCRRSRDTGSVYSRPPSSCEWIAIRRVFLFWPNGPMLCRRRFSWNVQLAYSPVPPAFSSFVDRVADPRNRPGCAHDGATACLSTAAQCLRDSGTGFRPTPLIPLSRPARPVRDVSPQGRVPSHQPTPWPPHALRHARQGSQQTEGIP